MSNSVPVEPGLNLAMTPPDGRAHRSAAAVDWRYVSPDYFSLFQNRHSRVGRTFTDDHRTGRPPVAVVNEAFARAYFGRVDATGQTITFGNDGPREIIGVVADVKGRSNAGFVRNLTLGALGAASCAGGLRPGRAGA